MATLITCKLYILLVFYSFLFFSATQAQSSGQSLNLNVAKTTQNLTKIHFYFHDIPNGKHPTSVIIARPANQTTIGFGTLVMMDDPLTEGPELSSKLVGRAQGMYAESSQSESSLLMTMTFSFTRGIYNGSSISILGRYRVSEAEREMPVVGGSGLFRLARGYALAKTFRYDVKTGVAVSEYNVYVLHYDTPLVE